MWGYVAHELWFRNRISTVSYTHLDVYKRQLINNLIMETKLTEETRVESDLIGAREIPASALYGVQTLSCLLYTSRCV